MNHEELRKTYQPGQLWETRIVRDAHGPVANPQWVPIPVYIEPQWDPYQEYRQLAAK